VLRSLYYYAHDDATDPYYGKLGIYPASELLIQMINYTERWDGRHVTRKDDNFEFLIALKNILPQFDNKSLPIVLPTTDNEPMERIVKYLEKNISERLTVNEVSSRFNMSERTLSRLFQSTMQMTFLQYVKTIRMVKAIEMLLKTQKPIGEIAFDVGYVTISSFSDAFHEFTHARPSDFRRS
jgi:AraC-like DNA-binding protein